MSTTQQKPYDDLSERQLEDIKDRLTGIHVVGFEYRDDESGGPGIGEIGTHFWEPLRISAYVTLVNLTRSIGGVRS